MRKMVFGKKLSRGRSAREALFKNLIEQLILKGKIVTTKAKAKSIQAEVDKFVTLAKKGTLSAQREAASRLLNKRDLVAVLFNEVAPTFGNRTSGFTRIINLNPRRGDAAEMASIEWVEKVTLKVPEKKVKKAKEVKETKKTVTKKEVVEKTKTVKKTAKK